MSEHTAVPALSPVSVLGLGAMGSALARAFVRAGHPTTVWNRTPAKAEALAADGAVAAATPGEAVAAGELVVVCVVDYGASQALLEPLAAALKGRTLVNLTSDTPAHSRAAAAWAAEHGIDYLDGSVMVPTAVVGQPAATILYSGAQAAFDAHQETLQALGGNSLFLGTDHGTAALYDVAMLSAFYATMAGFAHAFALAGADGVGATEFLPYIREIVTILPPILDGIAQQLDAGDHSGEQGNLRMEAAGLAHIVHASHDLGVDASVLSAVRTLADRAVAEGHGADGFTRIVDTLRRPTTGGKGT